MDDVLHQGRFRERDDDLAMRDELLQIRAAAVAWRARWPMHCRACAGWGGRTYRQSHPYGSTSASEEGIDPCEAPEVATRCHRCGADGLTEDGAGPCTACSRDYDDGEPQP